MVADGARVWSWAAGPDSQLAAYFPMSTEGPPCSFERVRALSEGYAPASSPPRYAKAPASRPGLIGATQACSARGAAAAATALMRSGRKPDQWSSPATTTGACW